MSRRFDADAYVNNFGIEEAGQAKEALSEPKADTKKPTENDIMP